MCAFTRDEIGNSQISHETAKIYPNISIKFEHTFFSIFISRSPIFFLLPFTYTTHSQSKHQGMLANQRNTLLEIRIA